MSLSLTINRLFQWASISLHRTSSKSAITRPLDFLFGIVRAAKFAVQGGFLHEKEVPAKAPQINHRMADHQRHQIPFSAIVISGHDAE